MILKCKKWTGYDIQELLEKHKLTHEQFRMLTGIEKTVLSEWLQNNDSINSLACYALDRIESLLKGFFVKHD